MHSGSCLPAIVRGGALAAADTYIDGQWTSDDLVSLLRIFCRNLNRNGLSHAWIERIGSGAARIKHRFSANSRAGSRRNIAQHYDLGNDFFTLFLDSSLMYSSGVYESPDVSLEDASRAKLERICRVLDLQPGDHVLEIGTGWGGFALYAAREFGCRVTTTTISRNQHAYVEQRIDASGLDGRIELLQLDYRDLTGTYDKLVSIEMIEAVGERYLGTFFRQCDRLLRPQGKLLVQAITMPDQRYDRYRRSVDFIQAYVFPGGHLPSVGRCSRSLESIPN